MKIQSVTHNNRKRVFQVKVSKKMFQLPYSKVDPRPQRMTRLPSCMLIRSWGVKVSRMC